MKTLGERLAMIRGTESQENFAKKLEVSRSTYANYEQNKFKPDANFLELIYQKFSIDLNWLLTGDGKEPTKSQQPSELDSAVINRLFPIHERKLTNIEELEKLFDMVRLAAKIDREITLRKMRDLWEYLGKQIENLRNENDQNTKHQEPTANS